MLSTLIQKELKVILSGPKFLATFIACSMLLLLSVYIGVSEYKQAVSQYDTATQLADERIGQQSHWRGLTTRENRAPDPLQIFASGINYDIGRWSHIDADEAVKLKHSVYSDDPIFAVFRILDFSIIVQVVFSLFAILFTFDAVNGEKESGTLRLVCSNAVPRARYLIAKIIGSWLGLVVPILIPILLSLLLVIAMGVALTTTQWLRLIALVGISLLYVSLFVVVGVLLSIMTSRSRVSFLFSLVLWIGFVLILPRAGVMAAGHISPVPELAQVEALRDGYAKDRWEQFYKDAEERWIDRSHEDNGQGVDEAEMWARMELEDSLRNVVQREIETYERKLLEDLDNRRRVQQKLGFTFARFSPAAVYQLAATTLTRTDLSLKSAYEEAMDRYRDEFLTYVEDKSKADGPGGGFIMEIDSEKGVSISTGRENDGIDVSGLPKFTPPAYDGGEAVQAVMFDAGLLLFLTIGAFVGAFVSFLRYDVR